MWIICLLLLFPRRMLSLSFLSLKNNKTFDRRALTIFWDCIWLEILITVSSSHCKSDIHVQHFPRIKRGNIWAAMTMIWKLFADLYSENNFEPVHLEQNQIIWFLRFLRLPTRPDIPVSVLILLRSQQTAKAYFHCVVRRVIRYRTKTAEVGFILRAIKPLFWILILNVPVLLLLKRQWAVLSRNSIWSEWFVELRRDLLFSFSLLNQSILQCQL